MAFKNAHPAVSINRSELAFSFVSENSILFATSFACIIFPIVLHFAQFPNQLLVGTIVNASLALCALYLPLKKSLPVILIPAIAALATGLLFGPLTSFLVYLVPFIWIGNAIYVVAIKSLKVSRGINYGAAMLTGALLKSGFIGVSTFALISLGFAPQALLVPMSIVQFATAVLGGCVAGATLLLKK